MGRANGTGKLYLTSGGRITLDDHNCEAYSEPYDRVLMTKEELTHGISVGEFFSRLAKMTDHIDRCWAYAQSQEKSLRNERKSPNFKDKIVWKDKCGFRLKTYVRKSIAYHQKQYNVKTLTADMRRAILLYAMDEARENGIRLNGKVLAKRIRSTIRHEIHALKRRSRS
jgi:hypothetical protein